MKKSYFSFAVISTLFLYSAHADTIGFGAGYKFWNPEMDGSFRDGSTQISLDNDLGYSSKIDSNIIFAYLEHPIPILPNLKIINTDLSDSSTNTLNRTIDFDGNTYATNTQVSSSIKLDQTDFIFYYETLDNWVNLDLGLNAKYIDGDISISDTTQSSNESFDVVVPMLYANAKFDFPLTGLSANVEGSVISYSGSSFYDYLAGIQYTSSLGIGFDLGYKNIKLELDDIDDIYTDIEFSGFYGAFTYKF